MPKPVLIRAGIGAIFIGIGVTLLISASRSIQPHEISPEETAEEVAAASAELAEKDDYGD